MPYILGDGFSALTGERSAYGETAKSALNVYSAVTGYLLTRSLAFFNCLSFFSFRAYSELTMVDKCVSY